MPPECFQNGETIMTSQDFKMIADAIKAVIKTLSEKYKNFDVEKFKEYLFKEEK